MSAPVNEAAVWQALEAVKDPEIPVISVVEMGIVRDVVVTGERVTVDMTPTFSGCPALDVMRDEIARGVRALGVADVVVRTVLSPPWTTDWISDDGREKLRAFGLAPPRRHGGDLVVTFFDVVDCPRCGGRRTALRNAFGATLCRAIYYCHDCQEPFEQFKPL